MTPAHRIFPKWRLFSNDVWYNKVCVDDRGNKTLEQCINNVMILSYSKPFDCKQCFIDSITHHNCQSILNEAKAEFPFSESLKLFRRLPPQVILTPTLLLNLYKGDDIWLSHFCDDENIKTNMLTNTKLLISTLPFRLGLNVLKYMVLTPAFKLRKIAFIVLSESGPRYNEIYGNRKKCKYYILLFYNSSKKAWYNLTIHNKYTFDPILIPEDIKWILDFYNLYNQSDLIT